MKNLLLVSSLLISSLLFPSKSFCQEAPGSDGHENDTIAVSISPGYSLPINGSTGLKTLTNYPNPIITSTVIQYNVPIKGHTSLKIYSLTGHLLATVFDSYREAGNYKEAFNASNLSVGAYVCRLITSTKHMATATRLLYVVR